MCGITGFFSRHSATKGLALEMAKTIASRGPDDAGEWISRDRCLALAHRRLSIVDLSSAGHQPMVSVCGNFTLAYNGEIYNYLEIRKALETELVSYQWQGHSDTEVLLQALAVWGVEKTLCKINGMFAFAFWDEAKKALFLARDRMGEKPLFYGRQNNMFYFGSELKSIKVHPSFTSVVNRDALALYMRHSYVPSPYSIYQNIFKLKPAHYITVTNKGENISDQICYWNMKDVAEKGINDHLTDDKSAIVQLDFLLQDSIKKRMMADVPLGAFLSGGYDSTTVAALMQAQSANPVKTFSIGFNEDSQNEAVYAKQVARHLGTDHTELYLDPKQALDIIPKLPEIYDEPFGDSSQVPTYLVSQLAKQHVTVALSGDGGDELFCGYNRYKMGASAWTKMGPMPKFARPWLAAVLNHFPGRSFEKFQGAFPTQLQIPNIADRLPKLAALVEHKSVDQFYKSLLSTPKPYSANVIGANESATVFDDPDAIPGFSNIQDRMMYLDMLSYLPDDILQKVDRASMAVSLETRVPLLDHRLVEYSWRVPLHMKVRAGRGKWLLRQVLYNYVPEKLMDRPKQGFSVPIESWIRGELRDWVESLLDSRILEQQGYFEPQVIRKMLDEHINGSRRWHAYLWNVLMFQAWSANNGL